MTNEQELNLDLTDDMTAKMREANDGSHRDVPRENRTAGEGETATGKIEERLDERDSQAGDE
jgi:hypothetical protein